MRAAARGRRVRLLAGAAGITSLGDFMAIFPLIVHVQHRTGSAFAVSALIFALWGPVVLAAGLAGAIVDPSRIGGSWSVSRLHKRPLSRRCSRASTISGRCCRSWRSSASASP
jgi:hypothetical protein